MTKSSDPVTFAAHTIRRVADSSRVVNYFDANDAASIESLTYFDGSDHARMTLLSYCEPKVLASENPRTGIGELATYCRSGGF